MSARQTVSHSVALFVRRDRQIPAYRAKHSARKIYLLIPDIEWEIQISPAFLPAYFRFNFHFFVRPRFRFRSRFRFRFRLSIKSLSSHWFPHFRHCFPFPRLFPLPLRAPSAAAPFRPRFRFLLSLPVSAH